METIDQGEGKKIEDPMKRFYKVYLLILLSFVAASACLLAYQDEVRIISIEGEIKILPKNKVDWAPAKIGMVLRSGDRIKTGADSQCNLAFDNKKKNIIAVLENSDLIVLLKENEKIEIIEAGIYARLLNIPKGSTFEIKTPRAVCGARGTGLGIKANSENTEAASYRNDIYVRNVAGEEEIVFEGFKRNVDKYGKISGPIALIAEEIERYNSWSTEIDNILRQHEHSKFEKGEHVEKTEEASGKVTEKVIDTHEQKSAKTSETSGGGGGN